MAFDPGSAPPPSLAPPRRLWPAAVALAAVLLLDALWPTGYLVRVVAEPLVALYRLGTARVERYQCPSDPSCSAYLLEAARRRGLAMGTFMAVDRLLREADPAGLMPLGRVAGKAKYFDPVAANDAWWSAPDPSEADSLSRLEAAAAAAPAGPAAFALGEALIRRGELDRASQVLGRIPASSPQGARAAYLARTATVVGAPARHSPEAAGIMSAFLPGLGQLWLGRRVQAAWAAGLTLGAALVALVLRRTRWLAGALGVLALALHGGNVYNAMNLAHRLNALAVDSLAGELLRRAAGLPGP